MLVCKTQQTNGLCVRVSGREVEMRKPKDGRMGADAKHWVRARAECKFENK